MNWEEARPVLQAAYRLMDEDDEGDTSPERVAGALGKPPDDDRTERILGQLWKADYITGSVTFGSPAPSPIGSTEKGLQQVAGWPSPSSGSREVELLIALLDERIADESQDENERGRLRRFRDAVTGLGRDVGADVLAAYLARISGVG